jgi:hypothetical protein|tara:strand:+ start:17 stop:250 length:234 start_codon:yes stop_codon:yes gene_type:complete
MHFLTSILILLHAFGMVPTSLHCLERFGQWYQRPYFADRASCNILEIVLGFPSMAVVALRLASSTQCVATTMKLMAW